VSCEFLADNREEIVFLIDGLHRVVLLYQGGSPAVPAGTKLRGLGQIVSVLTVARYCQK
jgi:hypothetical protein